MKSISWVQFGLNLAGIHTLDPSGPAEKGRALAQGRDNLVSVTSQECAHARIA
jgi:hypothetical protein